VGFDRGDVVGVGEERGGGDLAGFFEGFESAFEVAEVLGVGVALEVAEFAEGLGEVEPDGVVGGGLEREFVEDGDEAGDEELLGCGGAGDVLDGEVEILEQGAGDGAEGVVGG
jgi:hypothetical protein